MPGFTQFDNQLLEKVLTSDLTKRQLKILLLVIRFSAGYQKSYAVLRKNDYAYAGVSQYCITEELKKLANKKVIVWIPDKDMVWVNPELSEWAVEKRGEKSVDKVRRFFKISTKNSLKQQLSIYQNSNYQIAETASPYMYRKKLKKEKERVFMRLLREYFLKVAPLEESEMFILRQVVESFPVRAIEQSIDAVSQGHERSFSYFLKTLDDFTAEHKRGNANNLGPYLDRIRKRLTK